MSLVFSPALVVAKVDLDESVFRKYGFQKAMNLKWNLEDIIDSFLETDYEARGLIEEMLDEIQKK